MFISTYEKNKLFNQLSEAVKELSLANSEITVLKGKIKALEGNLFVLKQIVEFNKKASKPTKVLTPEQKAKQREYMKKYTARKREEKKAQLAQAVA